MIKLLGKIPNDFFLAVSGGIDSMVVLDFLMMGRHRPVVAHFNHGTEFGNKAAEFVKQHCLEINTPIIISNISRERKKDESMEEYWRNERLKFFKSLPGQVVTAHTLDDVTEFWIFSSLHGEGKLMPYSNGNVIRPFLLTPKSEILARAKRRNIKYMDDPANSDEKYMRSIIRHKIMPEALRVNPGLRTVIRKKLEEIDIDE